MTDVSDLHFVQTVFELIHDHIESSIGTVFEENLKDPKLG